MHFLNAIKQKKSCFEDSLEWRLRHGPLTTIFAAHVSESRLGHAFDRLVILLFPTIRLDSRNRERRRRTTWMSQLW